MDPRKLRYYAAVLEHGGFAQAAVALHVTQPALSIAVRKLEEELGHTLLERQARPLQATVYGQAVYRSWQAHSTEQQRLVRELRGMADLNTAEVSLVLGATFPLRPVLAALESLRQRYPGFRLRLGMGTYTGDLARVVDGSVDIILSQLPSRGPDPRLLHEPLIVDRFRAVCRRSHPLARKRTVAWPELLQFPWSGGGPFDAFLSGWSKTFAAHGVAAPQATLHTTSIAVTLTALLEHDYLAMLPVDCIAEQLASKALVALPVEGLEWQQQKGASWLQSRAPSPAVAAYMEQLRAELLTERALGGVG